MSNLLLQAGTHVIWLPEYEQSAIVMMYLYLMGLLLIEANYADEKFYRKILTLMAVCLTILLYIYITK